MIIGLVGSPAHRSAIQDKLKAVDSARHRRGYLKVSLGELEEGCKLNSRLWLDAARSRHFIAVVCLAYQDQAEWLRQERGVVWHLLGRPSGEIGIDDRDIKVAALYTTIFMTPCPIWARRTQPRV